MSIFSSNVIDLQAIQGERGPFQKGSFKVTYRSRTKPIISHEFTYIFLILKHHNLLHWFQIYVHTAIIYGEPKHLGQPFREQINCRYFNR